MSILPEAVIASPAPDSEFEPEEPVEMWGWSFRGITLGARAVEAAA